jgi:chaperonin GroES
VDVGQAEASQAALLTPGPVVGQVLGMSEPSPDIEPRSIATFMDDRAEARRREIAEAIAHAHELHPIRDGVLVVRLDNPVRTAGGIWIPPAAQNPMQIGRVVAVGQGAIDDDGHPTGPVVAVGDVVMYTGPWQGEDFEHGGRRYRKLDNGQLAAVIEDWDEQTVDVRHFL